MESSKPIKIRLIYQPKPSKEADLRIFQALSLLLSERDIFNYLERGNGTLKQKNHEINNKNQ